MPSANTRTEYHALRSFSFARSSFPSVANETPSHDVPFASTYSYTYVAIIIIRENGSVRGCRKRRKNQKNVVRRRGSRSEVAFEERKPGTATVRVTLDLADKRVVDTGHLFTRV